jgi:hypothetical protein
MLRNADRFKLHFGPYRTPRFKYGALVRDGIRSEVKVVGLTDGRIPWPIGQRGRARSLVFSGSLVRAVRTESIVSICYWWGIGRRSVYRWRKALGIPGCNPGTRRLKTKYGGTPAYRRNLRKASSTAGDPPRRAKVSAALKGRKRSEKTVQAIIAAKIGRPRSEATRRKISQTFKQLGILPPLAVGRLWSAREDELLRTLSAADVAAKTGRSRRAVYHRRQLLKLTGGGRNQWGDPKRSRSG